MKMLHGLLKSRFYNKCKSDLKATRTRIEIIRKRRNAMQKYLRNDIVDLLRNGLDMNAYRRAEALILEMDRSSCYELIDQYCEHVSNNLAAIDKQRESCPEECREAVSSLMYAAARFADLPELRHLRTLFSERYGKSLDPYLGKQFAEKLHLGLPSKDSKLRLLKEIASESGLEWSSKALENQLFNESTKAIKINNEFHNAKEMDYLKDLHPVYKDIPVDTMGRFATDSEPDENPLKYGLIPPPYTKHDENKPDRDSTEFSKKAAPAKSVRTRGQEPQPDQTSSEGSESDEKEEKRSKNRKRPSRALSVPPESWFNSTQNGAKHTRSASCDANLEQGGREHVHPRLPDYDDLVARLGSLRRKGFS